MTISSGWYTYNTPIAGYIQVYEQGWDGEAAQNWYVKYDGTYTNNLVFAGKYRMDFTYLPFYPLAQAPVIDIAKGSNTKDFTVTPYARVKNAKVVYDKAAKVFKAECDVEAGNVEMTPLVKEVRLMVYTDKFVNTNTNRASTYAASAKSNVASGSHISDLTIDPAANNDKLKEEFKYVRPHYFRVSATCANLGTNNNNLKNLSKVFKATPVDQSGSDYTIEEVSYND